MAARIQLTKEEEQKVLDKLLVFIQESIESLAVGYMGDYYFDWGNYQAVIMSGGQIIKLIHGEDIVSFLSDQDNKSKIHKIAALVINKSNQIETQRKNNFLKGLGL